VTASARSLRQAIADSYPLVVPGVYDGISARALAATDFEAAYIGSHATSAVLHGIPDVGYLTRTDMVEQIRRLAPIAGKPIIADGEAGFGNPLHVARTVAAYEHAGAAAIHLEDHTFGKHLAATWGVSPLGEAVDRLRAALDARASADFLIIARTDAFRGRGIEPVLERLHAFAEEGADAVFATGCGPAELTRIKAELKLPLISLNLPGRNAAELAAAGADVVIYFGSAYFAAQAAVAAVYRQLAAAGDLSDLEGGMLDTWSFDAFLGIDEIRRQALRLGLISD